VPTPDQDNAKSRIDILRLEAADAMEAAVVATRSGGQDELSLVREAAHAATDLAAALATEKQKERRQSLLAIPFCRP